MAQNQRHKQTNNISQNTTQKPGQHVAKHRFRISGTPEGYADSASHMALEMSLM